MKLNTEQQSYNGIPLRLIKRNYKQYKAKRFLINDTNQNVWIPNKHLEQDGTIKKGENLDYIFRKSHRKLEIASVPNVRRSNQHN
ncbi:hypothetical protein RS399_04125 [Bacillus inaquosorum]|uniref:hypothetical protein n=1 Tax=Bacillus inaquosorum TaxID=483913 RepID=UPI0028FC25F6|nr:hypothetical protein [Bacillus inaquosorum]WNW25110.1 hypothetical protein RS399_04125 [Bacillus inaquosorum]